MREFTKAMFSLMLAGSILGLKEVQNVLIPREPGETKGPATKTLDSVTQTILDQLDDPLRSAFSAADNAQRFFVGLGFNLFLPFISNYGSASSREAAWERGETRPGPMRDPVRDLGDRAKAAMEQQDKSWREDIPFKA